MIHLFFIGMTELTVFAQVNDATPKTRIERFDREPQHWEGINNRGEHFEPQSVTQDYGYSANTNYAGGSLGEIGGTINPAGETAYYAYRLPNPLTFSESLFASGTVLVKHGAGHFLLGFFNPETTQEWRTPNSLAIRINGRGDTFHCHVEYCTSRWRSGAGVIGEIIPGSRITPVELPANKTYVWKLTYEPDGADGKGMITLEINGIKAECVLEDVHRNDGATFTHFGLLPVLKAWDSPGEAWMDDMNINGASFNFTKDPAWEQFNNRTVYQTKNTRPHFDFGWSPTHWAGGMAAGELGGLIFRGDCRYPSRMASYGDPIQSLSLQTPFFAKGKVSMLRGVTDSTASIGFYHSKWSMQSNSSQSHSIPMNYLGINIEGPSSEGFYFYPVYRVHGELIGGGYANAPRIYPDRTVHEWELRYDPSGADGSGQITVRLDEQTCSLDLDKTAKGIGALFDRFGICTPWIDGNSVTVFFDDLEYTSG